MSRPWSILLLFLPFSTNAVESHRYFAGRRISPSAVSCALGLSPAAEPVPVGELRPPLTERHDLNGVAVINLRNVDHVVIRTSALPRLEITQYLERPDETALYDVSVVENAFEVKRVRAAGPCEMEIDRSQILRARGTGSLIQIAYRRDPELKSTKMVY